MASKRPRKLKSSRRTGSRAARSSQAPVGAKRRAPAKKKTTSARKAATPKRVAPAAGQGPAPRLGPSTPPAPPRRAAAPTRAELLAQARAAGMPGRHRMTVSQLRAALARLADRPAAATASSGTGRVSAPQPPPPVAGLPWRYQVTELVAMPVDPLLVHVYWELLPEAVAGVRGELGPGWDGASQVLRAYDVAGAPPHNGDGAGPLACDRHHFDLDVAGDVGSYYVHLWTAEQTLVFEIGWRSRAGRFVPAARSNRVSTPRNAPCGGEERWMTVRGRRIVPTPPEALPREAAAIEGAGERGETAPWSATFPVHRGWGGRQ